MYSHRTHVTQYEPVFFPPKVYFNIFFLGAMFLGIRKNIIVDHITIDNGRQEDASVYVRPSIWCQSIRWHNASKHKCFGAASSTSQLKCVVMAQHTHRRTYFTLLHTHRAVSCGRHTYSHRLHERNKYLSRAIKYSAVGFCHWRRCASAELSN